MYGITFIIFLLRTSPTEGLTSFICESYTGTINCTDSPCTVLNITYANWGRTSTETCKHSKGNSTGCSFADSTAVIQGICQNNITCALEPSNDLFGVDPCSGVSKYLEVEFQCVSSEPCTTTSEPTASASMSIPLMVISTMSSVSTMVNSTKGSDPDKNTGHFCTDSRLTVTVSTIAGILLILKV